MLLLLLRRIMDKLGTRVGPYEVVSGGSQHQHGVWSGVTTTDLSTRFVGLALVACFLELLLLCLLRALQLILCVRSWCAALQREHARVIAGRSSRVSCDVGCPRHSAGQRCHRAQGKHAGIRMEPVSGCLLSDSCTLNSRSLCSYNNIWNTNYILWYPFLEGGQDADSRFRFQVAVSS